MAGLLAIGSGGSKTLPKLFTQWFDWKQTFPIFYYLAEYSCGDSFSYSRCCCEGEFPFNPIKEPSIACAVGLYNNSFANHR
jgi:hypothetical protein